MKIRSSPCALPLRTPQHSKKDLACLQCHRLQSVRSIHPPTTQVAKWAPRFLSPAGSQGTSQRLGGQVNPAKCSADLARIAGLGRVGLRVASVRDSGSPRPVNVWEALEPFDPSGEAGAGEAVWEVASGNSVAVGIAARAAETQMRVSLPEARAPLSCVRTPARRGVLVFVDACSRCQVYLALALCWTALVLYRRS
jgi:hypothetical protein